MGQVLAMTVADLSSTFSVLDFLHPWPHWGFSTIALSMYIGGQKGSELKPLVHCSTLYRVELEPGFELVSLPD